MTNLVKLRGYEFEEVVEWDELIERMKNNKQMTEHDCPYDNGDCEVGAMCVECCADNNVYRRY